MSDDLTAYLYINFNGVELAQRFAFFMNEDTRPDFPDEVPENEAPLVDIFELMPDGGQMQWPSETECTLQFYEDAFEAKEQLILALPYFDIKLALLCEDDFDYCHYKRFDGNFFDFLYSPEALDFEDDDEQHNRQLSEALIALVAKAEAKGKSEATLCLGRALANASV